MTATQITQTTVVSFRAEPNGAYRWMKGLRRGYYRIQVLASLLGSDKITSKNVVSQESGREGIEGVTTRSAYYIGDQREKFEARAAAENAARDAAWLRATHRAE